MRFPFLHPLLFVSLITTAIPGLAKTEHPTHFIGCDPSNTLFFAFTKDGKQAVEFCRVKDHYRYTFGPFTVEDHKLKLAPGGAEQATLKPGEAGVIHKDMIAGFALKRGNSFTWISTEENGETSLMTAEGGWDGWETPTNQTAIVLDKTKHKVINNIEAADIIPFTYDYTNVQYD